MRRIARIVGHSLRACPQVPRCSMATAKEQVLSAEHLSKTDPHLKDNTKFQELHRKYQQLADAGSVERTLKALQGKGHDAWLVNGEEDFLKLVEGSTLYSGGSTTLMEVGFIDYLKKQTKWTNYKADWIAATGRGDQAAAQQAFAKGCFADFWFAGCGAISEEGDIVWGSATGTRVAHVTPRHVVFVAGINKITPDWDSALKRLIDYQKDMESARSRIAFKVAGSQLHEIGAFRDPNPYAPKGRVKVILLNGAYGF